VGGHGQSGGGWSASTVSKYLRYDEDGNAVWVDKHVAQTMKRAVPREEFVDPALGITKWQVKEFAEARKKAGVKGEFREDPRVPGFYDWVAPNEKEFLKAGKLQGLGDAIKVGGGSVIGAGELADAERLMRQKYPVKDSK
jgi:hypothetical protein